MQFTSLPPELLASILLELDLRSLVRCRRVCILLKDIIDQDVRVQYQIELAAAGMEDGPPSTLTAADRLRMLKARQEAWDRLAWTSREEVAMARGGVWELYGGVLAQAEGTRTLVFKQLPSATRGIEGREWRIEDVGVDIRDFGMDPSQDLLVIMENRREQLADRTGMSCSVHLKSLTTGQPHPAAPRPALVAHVPQRGHYTYAIQVSESYVGILMTNHDGDHAELLIWNWKTGQRHLHLTGSDLASFSFLTSRHVLLASLPTMELDENNVFHGDDPRLLIIDLERTSGEHEIDFNDLDYLCAFHYPAIADSFATVAMSIRSDPAPNWTPSPDLQVPFHIARQDRLFVITLGVIQGNLHALPLISLVPSSTFLACIDSIAPEETGRVFEWSEWGPKGSRLVPGPPTHTSVWVCYVYGMTFAMSMRQGSQRAIVTFDFNPLAVRRAQAQEQEMSGSEGDRNSIIIDDDRIFRPENIFKEEVRTALPHLIRKTSPFGAEGEGHFDAVMISEDSLVMVSSQSHIRKYRILTF
ncbi:hypothetical protein BV20DRAFT_940120 [Pilatotrama ljubarskyi]|nr:hypothetical protein BV20DRAFT_940120 [Pilatotrama ljubarskyi]